MVYIDFWWCKQKFWRRNRVFFIYCGWSKHIFIPSICFDFGGMRYIDKIDKSRALFLNFIHRQCKQTNYNFGSPNISSQFFRVISMFWWIMIESLMSLNRDYFLSTANWKAIYSRIRYISMISQKRLKKGFDTGHILYSQQNMEQKYSQNR